MVCALLAGCAAEPTKSSASSVPGPAGDGLPAGVIGLLAVLVLLAAAAGYWAGARTGRTPATAPPAPDPQLVRGLISSHDLTGDDAQRGHIEQVLQGVGVVVLRPAAGSPLTDPRLEVVGTRAAPSGQLAGSVADVVRVGWVDGTVLVRPAQVVVYAPPEAEERDPTWSAHR